MSAGGGERWDAVVVGGGPAGAATATHLARRGHSVLLLDRSDFPRRKPCGECLNPAAVAALERLGVWEAVRSAGGSPLYGWRIGAGANAFEGSFPDGVHGWGIARDRLDKMLLDHATRCGVTVRLGARVTDLIRRGPAVAGVQLRGPDGGPQAVHARLVVGADGLRSVVVRRLGLLRRGPRLRKVALTAHVTGIGLAPGRGELRSERNVCLGVADVGDGLANVTAVFSGERGQAVAGRTEEAFDEAIDHFGLHGAERVDGVLATGPFDWPVRCAVADGALLVGDAAGYYDPFTGQGVFRALRGAEAAAEAAHAALQSREVSARALACYEQFRRGQAAAVRLQHAIEAVLARPRLFGFAAARLAQRPALADALVRVTGDLEPVRSLLRPQLLAQWVR